MKCNLFLPHLPYKASEISLFESRNRGVELIFKTKAGKQSTFYFPPSEGHLQLPKKLIIIYSGWLSKALDWQLFIEKYSQSDTGFLVIDYPGYGNSKGTMNPKTLHLSSTGAIKALSLHLNTSYDQLIKISTLLGHSFGCGAALQFAAQAMVERIVLVAPFTTLRRSTFRKIGPLAWIIPSNLNNLKFIKGISHRIPRPTLIILHGTADKSLPVKMGRQLAALFPDWIIYNEIKGADHMDILVKYRDLIYQALKQ